MKNQIFLLVLAVAGVMLAGCQKAPVGYKCTTKITPGQEADFYDVEFELCEILAAPAGQTENRLASPKLSCKLGETAKIMVSDEQEQSGLFAEFFIPELEAGGTAHCTVHLKEKGQTKYLSDFQLTLPRKPTAADS
jgi:hypothetical protein